MKFFKIVSYYFFLGFNEVRKGKRSPKLFLNKNEDNDDDSNSAYDIDNSILKAIKLVPKALFWDRVSAGHERADSLVREVLSQFIVCQPIKHAILPTAGAESGQTTLNRNISHNNRDIENMQLSTPSPSPTLQSYSSAVPIVQIFGAYETVDCFALELELMQPIGK